MEGRRQDEDPGGGLTHGFLALLGLAVIGGLVLRGVEAYGKSLWLDEFHSLYVAWADTLGELVDRVSIDFHPPLYFVWLHYLRPIDAHHLRWLSILAGMAALLPLLALTRSMGLSGLARLVACTVLCAAPYQILYGTELRAYPMLQLASMVLAWAAFTDRAGPRTRFLAFAAATALGLYHHYFTAVAVLAVGAARLLFRAPGLLGWWKLVAAGTLGVATFLPWVVTTEDWIFKDPGALSRTDIVTAQNAAEDGRGVAPGSLFDQNLTKTATVPLRTLVPRITSLGDPYASFARPAATVFFALILCGVLRYAVALARREGAPSNRVFSGVLATVALGYTLTFGACLLFWNRVPEQYFSICAWGWPLLAGVVVDGFRSLRARGLLALGLVLACAVMGTSHALGHSRENTRGGVRAALARGGPDAIYTAIMWQPPWYSDAMPFAVYAPEVESYEPREVPRRRDEGGERPVVVVTRLVNVQGWGSLPERWKTIKPGRELVESLRIDDVTWVHVFEPKNGKTR